MGRANHAVDAGFPRQQPGGGPIQHRSRPTSSRSNARLVSTVTAMIGHVAQLGPLRRSTRPMAAPCWMNGEDSSGTTERSSAGDGWGTAASGPNSCSPPWVTCTPEARAQRTQAA
jgi:hypothetical protein